MKKKNEMKEYNDYINEVEQKEDSFIQDLLYEIPQENLDSINAEMLVAHDFIIAKQIDVLNEALNRFIDNLQPIDVIRKMIKELEQEKI